MEIGSRRSFFGSLGAIAAVAASAPSLLAQQGRKPTESVEKPHVHDGIYYFFGTGANDGYPENDQVTVTDPFEKHAARTMEALKKDLESQGCTMDSILHLEVFLCLPLADNTPMPTGKARFEAHQAQYEALNKIYHPCFSPGRAPSRACMAVEWIPGNSLIEIVGSARVVTPQSSAR
jgi:enamine deaminase RidA (YjgF/YER057c/UK114 family)